MIFTASSDKLIGGRDGFRRSTKYGRMGLVTYLLYRGIIQSHKATRKESGEESQERSTWRFFEFDLVNSVTTEVLIARLSQSNRTPTPGLCAGFIFIFNNIARFPQQILYN